MGGSYICDCSKTGFEGKNCEKVKSGHKNEHNDDYYDYEKYDYSYEYDYGKTNCSIYGEALKTIKKVDMLKCNEFRNDGFRCVPYYACKGGEIITNGAGQRFTKHMNFSF